MGELFADGETPAIAAERIVSEMAEVVWSVQEVRETAAEIARNQALGLDHG